jgi:hypothetical protein
VGTTHFLSLISLTAHENQDRHGGERELEERENGSSIPLYSIHPFRAPSWLIAAITVRCSPPCTSKLSDFAAAMGVHGVAGEKKKKEKKRKKEREPSERGEKTEKKKKT